MSSQLNVDTIVDKAGSGGSNVKMANTSTYVSEGGAVTQNTVQGLAKSWWTLNGTGTIATRDSFNVSSFDDVATGTYDANFSNNLSDGNFSFVGTTGIASNTCYVFHYHTSQAPSGGAVRFATETQSNVTSQDQSYIHGIINGDLA